MKKRYVNTSWLRVKVWLTKLFKAAEQKSPKGTMSLKKSDPPTVTKYKLCSNDSFFDKKKGEYIIV